MTSQPFADNVEALRSFGFQPRPVKLGYKACKLKGWQRPDREIPSEELNSWSNKYASYGIGLLLGSEFPDGTRLGALDIDQDDYVRVSSALLGGPLCGRIGAKGVAWFVRIDGDISIKKFDVRCEGGTPFHVGELLCQKRLLVIPPTIHPDTNAAYRWVGKPLLEIDYTDLPIVEV